MKVHIIGGGIGGMSAALHLGRLKEAGHLPSVEIHVYEARDRLGGKAASQLVPRDGEGAWPGEHGFRFFPNFYRCIVDTLRCVPVTPQHVERRALRAELAGKTAYDLLTAAREAGVARGGQVHAIGRAQSLDQLPSNVAALLGAFRVTPRDVAIFTAELTRFLLTCHERALVTWERSTLQDFLARWSFSPEMQTFLRSLRALSAMRAERGSLRTLFFTATQMLADFDPEFSQWDALLPGPTDYLMLEPWESELRRLGVHFHLHCALTALAFEPRGHGLPPRLARATFHGELSEIVAGEDDRFVLAVPYEVARPVLDAAPHLPKTLDGVRRVAQRPDNLGDGAEPMVGIQYWLRRDVPVTPGHAIYPEAEWAMTSVSQAQFWVQTFRAPLHEVFRAPDLKGVLSVIVSAWDARSSRIGKAPIECEREELAREAFDQIVDGVGAQLSWSDVIDFHVDSDIAFTHGGAHCPTPLWVSPSGSYLDRPLPDPGCANFFIASDWARTETDVGSMESADEAARWVVRAMARRDAPFVPESELPAVRPLRLWGPVEIARAADKWLFDHGLGHVLEMPPPARRVAARVVRSLRVGAAANAELMDQWELIHLAVGDRAHAEPWSLAWMDGLTESARAEQLDDLVRVLVAVDESGWGGTFEEPVDVLLRRISALG